MSELNYPVGMATFSELIKGDYTYVDKTAYIKSLLKAVKFKFLSRPRRFGKSLLLSTLEAYFEGRRELFKGLAADSMDLDWRLIGANFVKDKKRRELQYSIGNIDWRILKETTIHELG